MRVLVTGGAGFIGSHTVDALIARGADVVVVDRLSTGRRENLNPKAAFYELDIADPAFEEICLRVRPEVVYHLAFHVLVPKAVENPILEMDSIIGSLQVGSLEQPEVRKKAFSWLAERVNNFVNVLRPRMRSAAADYQSRGE